MMASSGYKVPTSHQEVVDWVTSAPERKIGPAPEGQVRLELTHSELGGMGAGSSTNMFKNIPLQATVFEVKEIVHLHVGTAPEHMVLTLKDRRGNVKAKMLEESLKLGFFNPANGDVLHCEDRDPYKTVAKYQDISNLKEEDRFVLTEEQYDKREGTFRDHLRKNPELKKKWLEMRGAQAGAKREDDDDKELAEAISVGDRCEVDLQDSGKERGVVMYVGKLDHRKGWYIGVKLDMPFGKNDGSAGGKRYFECEDGYGVFTWPKFVEAGDFPEEDLLASDDDDAGDKQ